VIPLRKCNTAFVSLFDTDIDFFPNNTFHQFICGIGSDPLHFNNPKGIIPGVWSIVSQTSAMNVNGYPIRVVVSNQECLNIAVTSKGVQLGVGGPVDPNGATLGVNGTIAVLKTGNGISIKSGTNCKVGSAALSAGVATILNTAITANSMVFLTVTNPDPTNVGSLTVTTKVAGTSFTVKSSNPVDNSTFNYFIVEPA
jgi:hypothetical protein